MTEPDRERRRWPPLLWGALALPLWAAGVVLPAGLWSLISPPDPTRLPIEAVALGLCLSTAALLAIDRRIGPVERPVWAPPANAILASAFLAGVGAAILGSELNNVLQAMVGTPLGDPPAPNVPAISMAILGLLQPICLAIVVHGVVQRACATVLSTRSAIAATLGIGVIFGQGATLQLLPILLLSAWIYGHGKAVLPAAAALMPVGLVTALQAFDLGPGIAGFDRTGADAQWQPIWFNVLGAALLAAGVQPLLRRWTVR